MMDDHMRAVVKKAREVSRITGGLFDITVKPLVDLWGFGVVRHNNGRPSEDAIRRALRQVDYQNLTLRARYLIKKQPGVEIDCNGIAQGYTSDVIAKFLLSAVFPITSWTWGASWLRWGTMNRENPGAWASKGCNGAAGRKTC